ncbi:MAG: hypothetical protein KKH94_10205, partial [Candidatus Omnitrophica bacterium]|nr:hypothetical protein [Candidatus Omnitrophota bacterium]
MVAMKYGFVIGVLIIGIATSLFADTIYFKNKETINGVIEKESAKEIVIDVGAGKFTFLRSEIDRIEKDALGGENAGEDNRLNASRDADVSSQLSVLMSTVRKERMLLARDKRKYDNIKRKIRLFEDTLARHYKEYEALAEENKQDTKKLKRHMTFAEKTKQGNRREEMNVINAKTRNYELKIRRFEHEKDIVGIKVSQSFGVLKTAIETLTVHYEKMVRENPEQQYESIKTMIDQFYDDVLQKGIPLRQQGKNFIADVRLNDALVIPLIV